MGTTQSALACIPVERVAQLILLVRGEKVILDGHLAELYDVETGALNRAVRRNASRFPDDFMFQLTPEEMDNLKCQIGISSSRHGGRRFSRKRRDMPVTTHGMSSAESLAATEDRTERLTET